MARIQERAICLPLAGNGSGRLLSCLLAKKLPSMSLPFKVISYLPEICFGVVSCPHDARNSRTSMGVHWSIAA
jgi:hypothetical protein